MVEVMLEHNSLSHPLAQKMQKRLVVKLASISSIQFSQHPVENVSPSKLRSNGTVIAEEGRQVNLGRDGIKRGPDLLNMHQ